MRRAMLERLIEATVACLVPRGLGSNQDEERHPEGAALWRSFRPTRAISPRSAG